MYEEVAKPKQSHNATPQVKTVDQYRKEKEEEEIFNSLNKFNTINEINRSFGLNPATFNATPDRSEVSSPTLGENFTSYNDSMGSTNPRDSSKTAKMIPNNKKTFERFFELKQQINNKKKEINDKK